MQLALWPDVTSQLWVFYWRMERARKGSGSEGLALGNKNEFYNLRALPVYDKEGHAIVNHLERPRGQHW